MSLDKLWLQFEEALQREQSNASTIFAKGFVNYSSIKSFLKYRYLNITQGQDTFSDITAENVYKAKHDFMKMLTTEMKKVDRYATLTMPLQSWKDKEVMYVNALWEWAP